MKTGILSAKLVREDKAISPGEYIGVWCGYIIRIPIDSDSHWELATTEGIRGQMQVTVIVKEYGTMSIKDD